VSFAAIILSVASQRVFIVVSVYLLTVRKLLDTLSYLDISVMVKEFVTVFWSWQPDHSAPFLFGQRVIRKRELQVKWKLY